MARTRPAFRMAVPSACLLALLAGSAGAADPDLAKLEARLPPEAGAIWRLGDPVPRAGGFDARGVTLLSHVPLNQFTGVVRSSGNDCWGYVSPSGREYAIMGLEGGYGFVEITDPTNPQIVATVQGPVSLWHDVKVIGDRAYGVSEGGSGVQIMDLSNIDNGQVTLVRNWTAGGYSTTHNIVVNEDAGTLWIVGANIGNGGLVHVDVTSPDSPSLDGGWTQMYVHDAQVVTWNTGPLAGRQLAFCAAGFDGGWSQTGLRVVDVTSPNSPQVLATLSYPAAAYAHQVWLSEDRKYLYLNDELDEGSTVGVTTTRVINVEDPANPVLVGTFTTGLAAVDHNLYTHNGMIFQANYRSGLRVFDALDPERPVEIAHFDTFPGSDAPEFNGAWSNYPFFPSGTVIVSDIERGLFVLRVDAEPRAVALRMESDPPAVVPPAGGAELTARVFVRSDANPLASVELLVDAGSGFQPHAATPNPDGTWTAHTPPVACGSTVRAYFRATTAQGDTDVYPAGAPDEAFVFEVADAVVELHSDDFETNTGWTVGAPGDNATGGIWTRVNPVGTIAQPGDAFSGSMCFVTGQHNGGGDGTNDVDNGRTTLTSPAYDLAAHDETTTISYWRWFSNSAGAAPFTDTFDVFVSGDNGQTWAMVESVGPEGPEVSGGWFQHRFHPADFVPLTSQVRLRFVAQDTNPQSLVEAAVDAVRIETLACENPVLGCSPADLAEPFGTIDLFDLLAFLDAYGAQAPGADLAEPFGTVDLFDLLAYLDAYAAGCP